MNTIRRLKNFAHLLLAAGANALYGFPSRGEVVIGVTGTDGKTTTSNLIYHILKESGKKAAVISTVGAIIDGEQYDTGFHVTTPSSFAIQKYIRLAKKKGCTHIVLEVTSHALDQNRIWGVKFGIGVLTNITHEHLDYHKDYQRYIATKLCLFKKTGLAVINSNGEWFAQVLEKIDKRKLVTYSLHGEQKTDVSMNTIPFEIKTNLIGDFNLENIIAAIATCQRLGIADSEIERAIWSFEAPVGRQEEIKNSLGFKIIVDFAHTPNSFENILPEMRKRTTGRLIHVFGSAGERDWRKRTEMGKSASFYDDIIVLTAEDPRSEEVPAINKQIREGIPDTFVFSDGKILNDKNVVYAIDDRKEAIEFALKLAAENDTVIITGKGHERSMNYGKGEIPWSDQKVVLDYLSNKHEI